MPLSRFLARQLGRPSGWFGRLVMAPLLNHGNRELLTAGLAQLEVAPDHAFLDVGFGGAATLSRLLRAGHRGSLTGVDFSEDMVRRAERRFARPIAAGRLQVAVGDVVAMPLPDAAFDRVLTANTVYFWPDLEGSFRSIARVLRPEGRLVVAFTGADKMREFERVARHGFMPRHPEDIEQALLAAGFGDVSIRALEAGLTRGDFLAVAVR